MTYSREDFAHYTPPRVMMSGSEYTTSTLAKDNRFDRFVPTDHYFSAAPRNEGTDLWLENGGRFRRSGALLEYTTPEVTSAEQLTNYQLEGDEFVHEFRLAAAAHIKQHNGTFAEENASSVYKRSGYAKVAIGRQTILEEMTAGHDETYFTFENLRALGDYEPADTRALRSYLASRHVWAGAGLVTNNGFEVSQKTKAIWFDNRSGKTTVHGNKPPYVMRNGRVGNQLEIRIGDGNMLPCAIRRKVGFTSLVLRMIEHGVFPGQLLMNQKSYDEMFQRATQLNSVVVNDRSMHPAEHQRRIADAALLFAEKQPDVPPEELRSAQEVAEICAVIISLPPDLEGSSQLADKVDWAGKLAAIRARTNTAITAKNIDAVMVDLQWEQLGARSPSAKVATAQKLERRDAIETARTLQPTTRAMARTAVLAAADQTGGIDFISWGRVDLAGPKEESILMPDPYSCQVGV